MIAHDAALAEIITRHRATEGPLLPVLNDVQEQFGSISEDDIRTIAAALNLSRADVHGVVSFYHDYHAHAEPLPVIKLCRAEACQARGVEALFAAIAPIAEGRVAVEPVYCLGLCAVGPAALRNGKVFARLNLPRMTALIEAVA